MFDAPARGDVLPVLDTRPLVKDPADGTKRARIDVGNVSPGTTAVITVDGDVDLRNAGSSTFQPRDAALTALSGLTIVDNAIIIGTGADAFETVVLAANVYSLLGAADYAAIRTQLGLVIGTNVQAQDATLAALAALTIADNAIIVGTGTDTFETVVLSANAYSLLGAADYAAMRTQLGLVIGTNVQAFDAQLASLAALSFTGNAGKHVRVNSGETDFELASPYPATTTVSFNSGDPEIDLSANTLFKLTLTADADTIEVINPVTNKLFMIEIIQGGAGSFDVLSWFPLTGVSWKTGDGNPPTLSTTPGASDVLGFWPLAGNLLGFIVGLEEVA